MEKEKKFISLVVYLHDDESNIEEFLSKIIPATYERFSNIELVCVDDACTDGTLDTVSDFMKDSSLGVMTNIVHMSYYQGLESAMNAGRDLAIGDFVYEFDSCLVDYEPTVLYEMYEKLLSGYDIVSAASDEKGRFSSRLFYGIYNRFSREKAAKVGTESIRIISRRAINRVKSMGVYIPYRKAVYANCGLKSAHIVYKSTGERKKNGKTGERMSLAMDSFVYFTNALEKLSTILSLVFLLATVAIGVFALVDLIAGHATADGWLSLMGFLSIGFFGVFLLLTVVLKYLSALLSLVFKHQRYVISDIEKIAPKETMNND